MTPRRRVLVATAALALALLCAAATGAVVAGLVRTAAPPAAIPPGVTGLAELYVAGYLSAGEGTEERLAGLTSAPPDLRGVVPDRRYAARAAATAVRRVAAGRYDVTVGVDLLTAEATGYRADGLRFFSVTVLRRGGRLSAHGAPRALSTDLRGTSAAGSVPTHRGGTP